MSKSLNNLTRVFNLKHLKSSALHMFIKCLWKVFTELKTIEKLIVSIKGLKNPIMNIFIFNIECYCCFQCYVHQDNCKLPTPVLKIIHAKSTKKTATWLAN